MKKFSPFIIFIDGSGSRWRMVKDFYIGPDGKQFCQLKNIDTGITMHETAEKLEKDYMHEQSNHTEKKFRKPKANLWQDPKPVHKIPSSKIPCSACTNYNSPVVEEPCASCGRFKKNWDPKLPKNSLQKRSLKKHCSDCEHRKLDISEHPCSACIRGNGIEDRWRVRM